MLKRDILFKLHLVDMKPNNKNVNADNKKLIASNTNKSVYIPRKEVKEEKAVKNAIRKSNPSPEIQRTTTLPTPTPIIEELEPAIPLKDVCIISAPGITNPTLNTEKRFKQKERRKDRKRDNKDKKFNKDEQKVKSRERFFYYFPRYHTIISAIIEELYYF